MLLYSLTLSKLHTLKRVWLNSVDPDELDILCLLTHFAFYLNHNFCRGFFRFYLTPLPPLLTHWTLLQVKMEDFTSETW